MDIMLLDTSGGFAKKCGRQIVMNLTQLFSEQISVKYIYFYLIPVFFYYSE